MVKEGQPNYDEYSYHVIDEKMEDYAVMDVVLLEQLARRQCNSLIYSKWLRIDNEMYRFTET